MSLQEQLAEISAAGAKRMPEEVRATMGAATQALRESGIMDRTIKVGDKLPFLILKNARVNDVNSAHFSTRKSLRLQSPIQGHEGFCFS